MRVSADLIGTARRYPSLMAADLRYNVNAGGAVPSRRRRGGRMPADPPSSPALRASDADRDRVIEVLRAAVAEGQLDRAEFDERLEAALSSRTLDELAVLTADLAGGPGRSGSPTVQAEDVIRIDKRGGSVRRCGRWVVPGRLELRSSWCDVMLDFTDAMITRDTLRIDMDVRGGSLILLVRPGTVVDAGSLTVRDTEVMLGPSAEPDAQAILHVQLAGRMCYGQIEARWRGLGP
jgi:hypothetical protein